MRLQRGRDDVVPDSHILLRGRPHLLRIRLAPVRATRVYTAGGTVWVLLSPFETRPPEAVLLQWLKAEARRVIPSRVEELARRHGFRYRRVMVRDQRTRWGSCSAQANLSFNFRLLLAPPEVLDYAICHELAHLRVPNHSPAFWELVGRLFPDFPRWRLWLRRHERELMAFGAPAPPA